MCIVVSLRNPLANCLWVTRGKGSLEPFLYKDKFDQNRWYMTKVRKVGQLYEFHFYKYKIFHVIDTSVVRLHLRLNQF